MAIWLISPEPRAVNSSWTGLLQLLVATLSNHKMLIQNHWLTSYLQYCWTVVGASHLWHHETVALLLCKANSNCIIRWWWGKFEENVMEKSSKNELIEFPLKINQSFEHFSGMWNELLLVPTFLPFPYLWQGLQRERCESPDGVSSSLFSSLCGFISLPLSLFL